MLQCPGGRQGPRCCEGNGDEQVTTSAIEGTCTLLRNTPAHAEQGENTGGESEQACALFKDQRVSQVIKTKGSPWKAVEKEPGDRERWTHQSEKLDFILRTLEHHGEWQSGQRT